jgi:hypothetical protein
MQKWEYLVEAHVDLESDAGAEKLRVRGEEGWELTQYGLMQPSDLWLLVFKRPAKTDADG